MTLLSVNGLSKRYGEVVALEDVTFDVAPASRTVVIGRSGSGKSTLLRILAGFEAPDRGRVWQDGEMVTDGDRVRPTHRRQVGVVAQDGALFPHLSVARNIGFGLPRGCPDRAEKIRRLCAAVELPESVLGRAPHELSGGQQQRVALARALARSPRLMLLDEPFSSLDAGLRETTRTAVGRILESAGIGCVLVTHDRAEALAFGDQVVVLRAGRVAQRGTPADVYRRPVDREVAALLGDVIAIPARIDGGHASCHLGCVTLEVPVADGPGLLMLRPDQLTAGPDEHGTRRATVLRTSFEGAWTTLFLRLPPEGGGDALEIAMPVPSRDAPRPGAVVGLRVSGPVYGTAAQNCSTSHVG